MTLVVATICLTVVAVFFMTTVAVVAFFVWYGSIWAIDRNAAAIKDRQSQTPSASLQSGAGMHPGAFLQLGAGMPPMAANALLGCSQWPDSLHSASGGSRMSSSFDVGSSFGNERYDREPIVVSPDLPRTRQQRHGVDAVDEPEISVEMVSPKAQPSVRLEDLQHGFASQLSCKFSGEFAFHSSNVAAVAGSYSLEADDICYCFLCLEEASSVDGGAGLALKPYGVNTYSARVWTVALARFVKSALGQAWAMDDGRVEALTDEWQYQSEGFLQMVKSCEVPFQRKHGKALIQSFFQEEIRNREVARARQSLIVAGQVAAPRLSRLGGAATIASGSALGAAPRRAALANATAEGQATRQVSLPALATRGKRAINANVAEANTGARKRGRK